MNTIDAFYQRLFRQNERVIKLGLDAVSAALSREPGIIGYPHILVAGTNGKGQTSALFANALRLLGIKTGLYTSPHLVDFRERIRLDGHMIPLPDVARIGRQILAEYGGDNTPEYSGIALTYFECCLMIALRYFRGQNTRFGVFEVGLGGRLDATNALHPALSVITSIGLDHQQYLGTTTPEIAREKAGIMRPGCPVVCGRTEIETLRCEARTKKCSAFYALGIDYDWSLDDGTVYLTAPGIKIPLRGAEKLADFQRDNAAVAAFSLLIAQKIGLIQGVDAILPDLVRHTEWVGRMWHVSPQTARKLGVADIIMDGAHNADGAAAMTRAAASDTRPRALVVNSCADKDIEALFARYLDVFSPDAIFAAPCTAPRVCTPDAYCARTGLPAGRAHASLRSALAAAARKAGPDGCIYITGSLYLLGDAIRELDETAALEDIFIP